MWNNTPNITNAAKIIIIIECIKKDAQHRINSKNIIHITKLHITEADMAFQYVNISDIQLLNLDEENNLN